MSQGVILTYNTSQVINMTNFSLSGGSCSVAKLFGKEIPALYVPPTVQPPPTINLPFDLGSVVSGSMASNVASFIISNNNYSDTKIVLKISITQPITTMVNGVSITNNVNVPNTQAIFAEFTAGSTLPAQISIPTILSQYQSNVTNLIASQPNLQNSNLFLMVNAIYVDSISNPTLTPLEHFSMSDISFDTSNDSTNGGNYIIFIFLVILLVAMLIYITKYK